MSTMKPLTHGDILIAMTATLGAVGVLAGAFGAHGLKDVLSESGMMEVWKTAVFYNLVHAVAGFAGVSSRHYFHPGPVWLWIAGIALFSGSLYALALGGPKWLGPVTPVGGALLIAGWAWLAIRSLRRKRESGD